MVAWSSFTKNLFIKGQFAPILSNRSALCRKSNDLIVQVRHGGGHHRTFPIAPSSWQWDKFKDIVHFYTMVGLIPVVGVLLYTNIFIGPAKLAPIPEGYEPKHWEYYKHPVTRFFAHYIVKNPQQEYEKCMHEIYEESEKIKLRQLEKKIKAKMAERLDYQAWYYRPAMVKYARHQKEHFDRAPLDLGS